MAVDGYECSECGHEPTQAELDAGRCPACNAPDTVEVEPFVNHEDVALRDALAELAQEMAALDEATRHAIELSEECARLRARVKALHEGRDDRLDVMRAALGWLADLVTRGRADAAYKFAAEFQDANPVDGS